MSHPFLFPAVWEKEITPQNISWKENKNESMAIIYHII